MKILIAMLLLSLNVYAEGPYPQDVKDTEVIPATQASKMTVGHHPMYAQIRYAAKHGNHELVTYMDCDANNLSDLKKQGYTLKDVPCTDKGLNPHCAAQCKISW